MTREIELNERFVVSFINEPENAEKFLLKLAELHPEKRGIYNTQALMIISRLPHSSPAALSVVSNWSIEEEGFEASNKTKFLWHKAKSRIYVAHDQVDNAIGASDQAFVYLSQMELEKWDVQFVETHVKNLSKQNRILDGIDSTKEIAKAPLDWVLRGGKRALTFRADALAAAGRLDEAEKLVAELLSDRIKVHYSNEELFALNSVASKVAALSGDIELARSRFDAAKQLGRQFTDGSQTELETRIKLASIKTFILEREEGNEDEILETIADVRQEINSLETHLVTFQSAAIGLIYTKVEKLENLNRTDEALREVEFLLNLISKNQIHYRTADVLYTSNRTLAKAGRYSEAIQTGEKAIELLKKDGSKSSILRSSNLNFYVGFARSHQGDWAGAAENFRLAAINPYSDSFAELARVNQVIALNQLPGKGLEAAKLFQELIVSKPESEVEKLEELVSESQIGFGLDDTSLVLR